MGTNIVSIGGGAFEACSNLTNITVPASVISIGNGAFAECTSLSTITLSTNIVEIRDFTFERCTSLASISIPNSVTNIGFWAFYDCVNLTEITIPDKVVNIGSMSFGNCSRLAQVRYMGNAPQAGSNMFNNNNNIATIYYLPGTSGWTSTFGGRPTALWKPEVLTSAPGFGIHSNQFGFYITWANGQVVIVDACTNLANPTWLPISTNTLMDEPSHFSDPQWTNHAARFYRLRAPF
jgi:hypothetical protein